MLTTTPAGQRPSDHHAPPGRDHRVRPAGQTALARTHRPRLLVGKCLRYPFPFDHPGPSSRSNNTGRLTDGPQAKHLPLARTHLPNFPITIITFSIAYARQFLSIPNVSFNVNQKVLMGPLGSGFLEEAKAAGRPVFVWTVNKRPYMRWCVRKRLDGVVTDDPALFRALCDDDDDDDNDEKRAKDDITAREQLELLLVAVIVVLFGWLKLRHLPAVDGYRVAMLEDATAATRKIKA